MFGLETELTKKVVSHGNNWKVFELSDVQEDINLLCNSNCHNEQTIATMNLTVYCEWLGPGPGLGRWVGEADRGVPAGWNNLCDLVGEVRVSLKSRGLSSESLIVVWNPSLNFLGSMVRESEHSRMLAL